MLGRSLQIMNCMAEIGKSPISEALGKNTQKSDKIETHHLVSGIDWDYLNSNFDDALTNVISRKFSLK